MTFQDYTLFIQKDYAAQNLDRIYMEEFGKTKIMQILSSMVSPLKISEECILFTSSIGGDKLNICNTLIKVIYFRCPSAIPYSFIIILLVLKIFLKLFLKDDAKFH